jgi:hypothetical protein
MPGEATGWYWLSVRSYDPVLKRFLQPDPSKIEGLRSYVYVGDDPVDKSDPSGLSGKDLEVGADPLGDGIPTGNAKYDQMLENRRIWRDFTAGTEGERFAAGSVAALKGSGIKGRYEPRLTVFSRNRGRLTANPDFVTDSNKLVEFTIERSLDKLGDKGQMAKYVLWAKQNGGEVILVAPKVSRNAIATLASKFPTVIFVRTFQDLLLVIRGGRLLPP